jgi:tetratricopeptide (TPR) repeat protein
VPGPYDLFISFHRACAEPVKRLSAALESLGVSCFTSVGTGSGSAAELPAELAESRVFLAWCCEDYFRSRACQRQLAAAFIAREREPAGAPERLLLVSAHTGVRHIYPVALRERLFAYAPGLPEAPDFDELAEWLREHCTAVSGPFGAPAEPDWLEAFDSFVAPAPLFEGRERELWDIHAALHPAASAVVSEGGGPVVVSGAAGQGKSCLAREYAFRFGPAHPGGMFRLAAREARPAASLAELSENPALKEQLSALLRRLSPEADAEALDLPGLSQRLGEVLAAAGQPFLWIVDDLPDGLNGPAFRQWLAPDSAGPWGRTLVTTRGRRYDSRAEAIHLPPLDEASALRLLLRESPPANDGEQEAVAWLLEDLGRGAHATAMAGALAALEGRNRRGPYALLAERIEAHGREAADIAVRFPDYLPASQATAAAALVLCAVRTLGESGLNLLRLAGELADATLPTEFIAECFERSGLGAEEEKPRPFAIYLAEPMVEPMTIEAARAWAETGMAALERLCLAERTQGGVRVYRLAARIVASVVPSPLKQVSLHAAALHALYAVAEGCVAADDWQRLAPLAAHARSLVGDLSGRPIDRAEDPMALTRRVRLVLILADMDAAQGARQRAMQGYRAAAAYLLRAMKAEPHNVSRQRDFARSQERIGDLLAAQGDWPGALDRFRKSLGIRAYLAKQDPAGPERQRDLLRHHRKIGEILTARGDVEGAVQSYRAAHAILEKLSAEAPADLECRFELAASFERLAALYIRLGDSRAALNALNPALSLYESLAEAHPERIAFVRAPAVIHNMMGDLLRARADLSGALERYRTALGIAERLAAPELGHPEAQRDLALCHNNLGHVLAGLEDPAGAAEHYRRYVSISERLAEQGAGGARRRDLAAGYMKCGMATEQVGDPAEALAHYRKARAILEKLAAVTPHNEALRTDLAWVRERIESLSGAEESGE